MQPHKLDSVIASAIDQHTPPEGIAPNDVVELITSLAQAPPDAVGRLAQLLQSAAAGQPLQFDPAEIGVDPDIVQRILEGVGNADTGAAQRVTPANAGNIKAAGAISR